MQAMQSTQLSQVHVEARMQAYEMAKKTEQISVRMSPEIFAGLKAIKDAQGIEPAEILRRLAEAAVEFYQENKYFAFPVKIQPGDIWTEIHRKTSANLTGAEKAKLRHPKSA